MARNGFRYFAHLFIVKDENGNYVLEANDASRLICYWWICRLIENHSVTTSINTLRETYFQVSILVQSNLSLCSSNMRKQLFRHKSLKSKGIDRQQVVAPVDNY